jgi:ACT domain-containing protein
MSGEEIQKTEELLGRFKEDIRGDFRHQLGIQREDFQKRLAVIGEGFRMLSEKIDRVEMQLDKRMDCLEHKLDAVAADLSAHRADTEAHRPIYRVKE